MARDTQTGKVKEQIRFLTQYFPSMAITLPPHLYSSASLDVEVMQTAYVGRMACVTCNVRMNESKEGRQQGRNKKRKDRETMNERVVLGR